MAKWSRRRSRDPQTGLLGERSSLRRSLYDALSKLETLKIGQLQHLPDPQVTASDFMSCVLTSEARHILTAAAPLTSAHSGATRISVHKHATLVLSVEGMLSPSKSALMPNAILPAGLVSFIDGAVTICHQMAHVEYVLRWLDQHATPGAIRHYWPTIIALVPPNSPVPSETPGRFVEPAGISTMLPLLRDTATIVAAAILRPAGGTDKAGLCGHLMINETNIQAGDHQVKVQQSSIRV